MTVRFQDYYETLGVARDASQDQIKRAYRALARRYHPDVNKEPEAEQKFKQINEAYDVLGDAEKRQRYDRLGANWKSGQEFTPPPSWQDVRVEFGGSRSRAGSQFSDFFETLFGQSIGRGGRGAKTIDPFEQFFGTNGALDGRAHPRHPQGQEGSITITLEDAFHGTTHQMSFQNPTTGKVRTLDVRVPRGVRSGSTIRLTGAAPDGADMMLKVCVAPHPRFEVDSASKGNLVTALPIAPWEAALGAKVPVKTLDGQVLLKVPPGTQSGQQLRLRGQGVPKRGSQDVGDLFARVKIVVPKGLSKQDKRRFEQMRDESTFNPRLM